MQRKVIKWSESPVRGLRFNNVVFNPSNRLIAACSARECIVFSASSGDRVAVIEQESDIKGVYFNDERELVTVTARGAMCVWQLEDETDEPSRIASFTIAVQAVHHVASISGEVVALVDDKKTRKVALLKEDGKLEFLKASLPADASAATVGLSSQLIAVADGKKLTVIARNEFARVKSSVHECRMTVDALGDANERNVFESVHVLGDTVAAALTIGRIYIWTDVETKGVARSTQSVHWHKTAPSLVLSPLGGLLSAGGEGVLCKWRLGKGAPTMLPRFGVPIAQLSASSDCSLLALSLEDNSIIIVDAAAMGVRTEMPTLSVATRSSALPRLYADPLHPDMVVMGAREGVLQWFHPASSTTSFKVDIALENGLDRDLPLYGVVQAYHTVSDALFTDDYAVTIEAHSRGDAVSRVRLWRRDGELKTTMHLDYNQNIPRRIVGISSYEAGPSKGLFILTDEAGRSVVLHRSRNQWYIDPSRDFTWKGLPTRATAGINEDSEWAAAYNAGGSRDAVVVVDVNTMRQKDVLLVDGAVTRVFWTPYSLVAATDTAVYCWSSATLTLKWRCEEGWDLRAAPAPLVWRGNQAYLLDLETGDVIDGAPSAQTIQDAMPFKHGDGYGVLATHRDGTLSILSSSAVTGRRRRLSSFRSSTTASGASASTTALDATPTPALPPSTAPSLVALSAPAHMLPPLSLLAPTFIRSCLLPPAK